MADIANSKLFQVDTGILEVQDACIVLVKTEWNASITDELEKGAISTLIQFGVSRIISLTVPGAFEIPFTIRRHWIQMEKRLDVEMKDLPAAYISLACVIRGDTPHFDYVCRAITDGVLQLNLELPVPTIFGVLTVDKEEQARERIGGKHGHKGEEAALTALKMISLQRSFN